MSFPPFQRVFAISAFEALRLVRLHRRIYPKFQFAALVDLVKGSSADASAHDYEAASHLDSIVGELGDEGTAEMFYQCCIEAIIFSQRPIWVRTIQFGRKNFVQKLSRDEAQCFEAAGLMQEAPADEVIQWWDRISGESRLLGDQEKLGRGRAAEKLSFEHEQRRLVAEGITDDPIWMAIEDNWVGYDILSYAQVGGRLSNRLIEVKATTASPLRFFVTRNEWEAYSKYGDSYFFHIWDLKTGNLYEKTGAQIAAHVPTDMGHGRWVSVEIRLAAV